MIKELIFSGKKYFEGIEQNYIGKTIIPPKKEINQYFIETTKQNIFVRTSITFIPRGKVIGQFADPYSKTLFLMCDGYDFFDNTNDPHSSANAWFKIDEISQNGGYRIVL